MPLSLLLLIAVFVAIAVRRFGRFQIPIWAAMLAGALAALAGGAISPRSALAAIDWEVMLFLFGMFVIGDALERSGLLFALAYHLLQGARSTSALVGRLLFAAAAGSALLMNDTLAIIGTPLALLLAREHHIDPRLLLLTLAFAITIGSVASPIGNPQNLLIALHGGIDTPFLSFARHLALPTLLSLIAAWGLLRLLYRREFHDAPLRHAPVTIADRPLARLAALSLLLLVALIALRGLVATTAQHELRLSHIALLSALPVLLFSPRRFTVLRHVDWQTLIFFAAMFVLMQSVWESGFLQRLLTPGFGLTATPMVLGLSVTLSQVISNVPMVALYLPLLDLAGGGESAMLALAAGSTLAGNLLLLGAASNVIIVQNAERRGGVTLGFMEFARAGILLTAVTLPLYWLFLPG